MRRWPWWAAAAIWMMAIFVVSSTPDIQLTTDTQLALLIGAAGHAAGFGLLATLIALGSAGRWRHFIALGATIAYAVLDEFHQSFVPGRQADPVDVFLDALGALAAVLLLAAADGHR